jgi:hypothetical protein
MLTDTLFARSILQLCVMWYSQKIDIIHFLSLFQKVAAPVPQKKVAAFHFKRLPTFLLNGFLHNYPSLLFIYSMASRLSYGFPKAVSLPCPSRCRAVDLLMLRALAALRCDAPAWLMFRLDPASVGDIPLPVYNPPPLTP